MPTWVRDLLSHDDPRVRSQVGRQLFGHRGRSHGHGLASGSLVEFTHGGGLWFGAVLRNPGRRLLVVDVRGRERWLRRDKILDLSPNRAPTLSRQGVMSHLRRIDGQRQARSLAVDLEPLWEIAAEEGEGPRVVPGRARRAPVPRSGSGRSCGPPARPVAHPVLRAPPRRVVPAFPRSAGSKGRARVCEEAAGEGLGRSRRAWVRRVADGEAPDPRPCECRMRRFGCCGKPLFSAVEIRAARKRRP